jgi:hypothetical protein
MESGMIQLFIQEPKLEQYFNYSQEEVIQALEFIVDNDIKKYYAKNSDLKLSDLQKQILHLRIETFHNNRDIGKSWDEIKQTL